MFSHSALEVLKYQKKNNFIWVLQYDHMELLPQKSYDVTLSHSYLIDPKI